MTNPRHPISVATSPAYLLAGLGVGYAQGFNLASLVFLAALAALTAGTAWMHWRWSKDSSSLDHAGMNATYLVLATHLAGGPWWSMALAGIGGFGLEYTRDPPNYSLMGICIWLALVAGLAHGRPDFTLGGIAFMGLGFTLWNLEGDKWHGAWHVATAIGTALLYLSLP